MTYEILGDGNTQVQYPDDAWELISPRLTDERRAKMLAVAGGRSEHIRLVLQDIYDPHNISACMRSAEAFGILNIDIVNTYQRFTKPSTVSKGSYNWLEINHSKSIADSIAAYKDAGYKIAGGFPNADCNLDDLPIDKPVAVIFGNEKRGVSSEWDEAIDYRFTIPMTGMVESLNISVSAALSMYTLSQRAKRSLKEADYYLNEERKTRLLNKWICRQSPRFESELSRLRAP